MNDVIWSDGLHDLMHEQVREILLVSSLYESFVMAEDGHLAELLLTKFLDLNLSHPPTLTHVSTGAEALALLRGGRRYDLIISSLQSGPVTVPDLVAAIRQEGWNVPLVALAQDRGALNEFVARNRTEGIERIFLWHGDPRLLFAIVKMVEDRRNAPHDTRAGVPVFIVVEDKVRFYSSFLPVIYAEVMKHSQAVLAEGLNLGQKLLLMRARPKILLATTFEEAWSDFTTYEQDVLGVISDIEFPHHGELSPTAGIDLARQIRELRPDIALTLQSSYPENEHLAGSLGARFLLKGSPVMLHQLREQLTEHFVFGDFVFRLPDGLEVGRAHDVRSLVEVLHTAPPESIALHAATNHFSSWLRARAEFDLARELRPRQLSDYPSIDDLRHDLIASIERHRRQRMLQTVADFDAATFETGSIARIGGGSLGGKARGLAFAMRLLAHADLESRFPGVQVCVPTAVVVATDVFESFLEANELRDVALKSERDADILASFASAVFPREPRQALADFLERAHHPLVVRSSSRLEDSPSLPYAGVFDTFMLPNDHPDDAVRLEQLVTAIKRVYASTFSPAARAFARSTPFRLEEEQMAVIVQELVGSQHGDLFYPDFAGVARSHNFYPVAPLTTEEGIVAVSLGLGLTVVNGEPCARFSPRHPRHIVEFSTTAAMLESAQREFWAVRLGSERRAAADDELVKCSLEVAERDGVLGRLASTYSPENDAIYDGIGRAGIRLVSFAPILKHEIFPLAALIRELLELGIRGTGSPTEIEFAVKLSVEPGERPCFGLVQLRPLAGASYVDDIDIESIPAAELICRSFAILGNGTVTGVQDLIVVDPRTFVRGRGFEAARAVARLNAELGSRGVPYILLGAGRWGSADPWLGIPVTWPEIAGVRTIVEVGFRDFKVQPSQGTHFFQNLVSGNVGYFTVNAESGDGFVDWDWLAAQPSEAEACGARHIRLAGPVTVLMNGRTRHGVIRKP
jgi:CheY-like chemotaxis protein